MISVKTCKWALYTFNNVKTLRFNWYSNWFLFCFYRLGPMVRSWCMRYESKHTYFKQVAVSLGNFINVPFTVAERHQKLQSLNYFNEGDQESSTVMKPLECGPGTICKLK